MSATFEKKSAKVQWKTHTIIQLQWIVHTTKNITKSDKYTLQEYNIIFAYLLLLSVYLSTVAIKTEDDNLSTLNIIQANLER